MNTPRKPNGGDVRIAAAIIDDYIAGCSLEQILGRYDRFNDIHQIAAVIGAAYACTRTMRAKVQKRMESE